MQTLKSVFESNLNTLFLCGVSVFKHFSMHRHFSGVYGAQTAHSAMCSDLWGGKNRMVLIVNCFSSTHETMAYFQLLQEH